MRNQRFDFRYNYHHYTPQDCLNLDERFVSDETLATAEGKLTQLVDEANARGICTVHGNGKPDPWAKESSREALWGMSGAFIASAPVFGHIRNLSRLRQRTRPWIRPALLSRGIGEREGLRVWKGVGGIVSFSRILADR